MAKGSILARISVFLGLDSGEFEKGVQKSKQSVSGFQKFMKSTGGQIAATIGAAFAVRSIIDFGKEITRLAGEFQGVSNAFKELGDPQLLDNLKEATKGTVSDLELMKKAVSAKNLGLPIQKLGTYFEFARRRAKETGQSVDYLTESIVNGIGRKSPLILDNLGISATDLKEEIAKVGDFGIAASNIIEREMGKMSKDIDTTAESTAKLNASWENYMTTLGTSTTGIVNTVIKSLNGLLNAVTETDKATQKAGKLGFNRAAFSELDEVAQKYIKFNDLVNLNAVEFANNTDNVKELQSALKYFKEEAEKVNKGTDEGRVKLISYSEAMNIIAKRIESLGKKTTTKLTDAQKKHLAEVNKLKEAQNELYAELNLGEYKGVENLGEAFKDALAPIQSVIDKVNEVKINFKALEGVSMQESPIDEWAEMELSKLQTFNDGVKAAMAGVVDSISSGFENAIASGDPSQFAKTFLEGFSGILSQFGKMLIALGIGMEAFKTSLQSLNPAVAIGAGVALIAVAGAIKSFLSSSKGGGGSTGGGSSSGDSLGTVSGGNLRTFEPATPESQSLRFELEGSKLVAATNRFATTNKLTT